MEILAYIHMALAYAQGQQNNGNCSQSETGNSQSYERQNAAYQADLYFEIVNNNFCTLQIAKA
ncbi:hypothetical protein [Argonema antarcticum]|uniref:hypothetical protein n=1 Tax=Argonema antarcticum TaxID=2942763 RepID=UPI0020135DFB|nr:hypothetical protein [Argonema antarcticum]MCL1469052.1 hypothetical protein [Argonema antarcticum A004/B2]